MKKKKIISCNNFMLTCWNASIFSYVIVELLDSSYQCIEICSRIMLSGTSFCRSSIAAIRRPLFDDHIIRFRIIRAAIRLSYSRAAICDWKFDSRNLCITARWAPRNEPSALSRLHSGSPIVLFQVLFCTTEILQFTSVWFWVNAVVHSRQLKRFGAVEFIVKIYSLKCTCT